MKKLAVLLALVAGVVFAGKVMAEPLTAAMCKEKAIAAAKLIEAEGVAAFEKIKDPNGEFMFGDGEGYIWIHDSDNTMIMHPKKPSLDGNPIADMRDINGKNFFINMTEIAMEKGAGWVSYAWPKPGKQDSSPKVSYVVKAVSGDKTYIAGSGIYDVTKDDIKKQFPGDATDED